MHENLPRWTTLELPYRDNEPDVSCIPEGRWLCTQTSSSKAPLTWEVEVPGRSRILFHAGNFDRDSRGCILVGLSWSRVDGHPAILQSAEGFKLFVYELKDYKQFHLNVRYL
jgi:hypothetical protein